MRKHMIMFKGGVETQEYFSIQLAKTFEKEGFIIYWFDLITCAYSYEMLKRYYERYSGDEFVAFTFNFNGIAGEEGLYPEAADTECFWDANNIQVFNMVVDHPLYYHKYLEIRPKRYIQISIDKNHIKYMRRFFPKINEGINDDDVFIPLGGTGINVDNEIIANKKYFAIQERPIDVIFTGNYTPPERFDRYLADMDKYSAAYYKELVEETIKAPCSLFEELNENKLKKELSEEVADNELKLMQPNLMYVDLSVRFHFRARVIAALADRGIKVHTFGAGWDLLKCRHPENIIQAGSVDSRCCLDKIFQSKISVNVMPWFKNGAHDRIFNSMLNGAVCVSDDSLYLRQIFEDNVDICFYSLENVDEVAEKVSMLLGDTDKMQSMADKAYEKCISSHTWDVRAGQILNLIKKCRYSC